MALKNSKQLETNLYELEIEIDGATFKAACERAYKEAVKNITIPGFRKGKAPRAIIDQDFKYFFP